MVGSYRYARIDGRPCGCESPHGRQGSLHYAYHDTMRDFFVACSAQPQLIVLPGEDLLHLFYSRFWQVQLWYTAVISPTGNSPSGGKAWIGIPRMTM